MPLINFKDITIKFEDKIIIENFNFTVKEGQKVALKGRSGSGKSTLLNILMGFQIPDKGSILYRDKELHQNDIEKYRREMCWLPQNVNILGRGQVENIIFHPFSFAENKKNKPQREKVLQTLSSLNLNADITDALFENLSGGEKQRIGILICMLLGKPLILLDEPSSALDRDSIRMVIDLILKDDSKTVLSTSHDEEWLSHCDKIVEL